jgi:AraC-like DNA-binding protein
VNHPGHLFLEETILQPSAEWLVESTAWVFLRIADGQACWIDPRKSYLLNAGDVLIVPPGRTGTLRASRLTSLSAVFFQFRPELLTGFFTASERLRVERAVGGRRLVRFFHAEDDVAREFKAICEATTDWALPMTRSCLLQLAVAVLVQPVSRMHSVERLFLPASKRVELLLRKLSEAELLDHTPADLASRCGCSARHLNKLFRGLFGVSVRSKQSELKLMKARQLLAESDLLVAQVANATGFREQGGFSMAFKKRFGVTPTEWRRHSRVGTRNNGHHSQHNPNPS